MRRGVIVVLAILLLPCFVPLSAADEVIPELPLSFYAADILERMDTEVIGTDIPADAWIIEGDEAIEATTQVVKRSIVVKSGGTLTISDATVIFLTLGPRTNGIHVMSGGKITVKNSEFKPAYYTNGERLYETTRFYMWIEGDANIRGSTFEGLWGGRYSNSNDPGGGIFLKGGSSVIESTIIIESMWGGITVRENTKALIKITVAVEYIENHKDRYEQAW